MKKMKQFALLMIAASMAVTVSAQEFRYTNQRIVNKSLAIGKIGSAAADSSAWLEIGDTSTTRALLLPRTDTSKILVKRPGLILYNRKDSSVYMYSGRRWIKL